MIRERLRITTYEEGCRNLTANEASYSLTTSDMSASLLSLPRELRDQIYAYVLVNQDEIEPERMWFPGPLSAQFLRTNKMIHREATLVLYAHNRFNFAFCDPDFIPFFLDKIGRDNAKHIRQISIYFPEFHYLDSLDPDEITLNDESFRILEKIQSYCANLSTLTMSLFSINDMVVRLDKLDCPKIVAEALKLVDIRFKAISTLQKIIVEVYEDCASDHVRRKMESHGWTVITTEHVDEEDFETSFSDLEHDYRDNDDPEDDDHGDDDYDIDDDSDYWRRTND